MAQLKITLMDDDGQELSHHKYAVVSETTNLRGFERAVEELRPQVLSDITHDLLAHEQAKYKKNSISEQRPLSDQNQDD